MAQLKNHQAFLFNKLDEAHKAHRGAVWFTGQTQLTFRYSLNTPQTDSE